MCPETLDCYFAGPNRTLPTICAIKFSSSLSTDDFIKKIQSRDYTKEAPKKVCKNIAYFVNKEDLTGRAKSSGIK